MRSINDNIDIKPDNAKGFRAYVCSFKKGFIKFIDSRYLSWIVISFTVTFLTELVNQNGFVDLIRFIFTSPHIFLINLLLVSITYSFVMFVKRKLFAYTLVTLLWTVVTVINLILLIQRNTQFNASDIIIFRYGMFITMRYFDLIYIILLVVAIVLAFVGIVILFKRGHISPQNNKKLQSLLSVGAVFIVCAALIVTGNLTGFLKSRFIDIMDGYTHNGFVYAFGCSVFAHGVEEPDDFDESDLRTLSKMLSGEDASNDQRPNVIFVQLESFIDPDVIKGIELESDPVANFNRLKADYPSGHLTVPVVGGGTANTEFEVLTGMNLEHFGTIDLPYEYFLDDNTCESIPYNFKALGYSAHAIHNFSAGFYTRDNVYSNLGFDTFTSFEYMSDIEYNDIGWAKDTILERYIMSALDSTRGSDLVFAVSVQGHGSYPADYEGEVPVGVQYTEELEAYSGEFNYYISQVYDMDKLIGSLTDRLSEHNEDTVVVFYGDHIPGINVLTDEMTDTGSMFDTEYVIWSNFELDAEDKDITSYQLSAHLQQILGFSSGKLTKLHQRFSQDDDYQNLLQTLEYDVTEGDSEIYSDCEPYIPTDLKFGVEEIIVSDLDISEEGIYIFGENFNEHSTVLINDSSVTTEYIDSSTLFVDDTAPEKGDVIKVAQINYQMPWGYLGETDAYVVNKKK